MNTTEPRYHKIKLVSEMLETPEVVRSFPQADVHTFAPQAERVLLTGEGSSRIFPAKHARIQALRNRSPFPIEIDGATQAQEYDLDGTDVYVASNSGKTAEAIRFVHAMDKQTPGCNPKSITAIVSYADRPLGRAADREFLLTCGPEAAVAATKSVVEQALFYDIAFRSVSGREPIQLDRLADAISRALAIPLPTELVERAASAPRIYFAGRNDGVAEELTLKTNEITRKASAYLEGTYAVHGIEEVMRSDEVVVVVDPFPEEEEKFDTVLRKGVGLEVLAIASRETRFPTIRIPDAGDERAYVQLVAGWNLLVEIGIALGIDLDTPERARKVGNEFTGDSSTP